MILMGLVPVVALGGESASLTIGGYVPPIQRISAVQLQTSIAGGPAIILQEQSNSAMGYTMTFETKTPVGQRDISPAFQITGASQPINVLSKSVSIWCPPNQRAGQKSARILKIAPSPASTSATVFLTVASE